MAMLFKEKDWCFCEFKLQQIQEIEDGRITSVSDSMFRLSGYDLKDRCYPLELDIKRISDVVAHYSNLLHAIKGANLNHPDLNRELIKRWVTMCEDKDNKSELQKHYDSLSEWYQQIRQACDELKYKEAGGVQIFR